MIFFNGELYHSGEQDFILNQLEDEINKTRGTKTLNPEKVIAALEKLGQSIAEREFNDAISQLNIEGIDRYINIILMSLKRENIEYKVKTELGEHYFEIKKTDPLFNQKKILIRPMPLGTLLHIAAGNVDGLPVFSVAEGLITGNVNILKLPQADKGLSIELIKKLIEIEPDISDFVYVFDTTSSDLHAIKKMAEMADGIVVWGGDAAISAVRQFAPSGCKLIEWGHKLGFAYISGYEDKEKELIALAEHIVSTRQLLCSSCQTIFLDTDSQEELHAFCEEFLPYLEASAGKNQFQSIDAIAERTLRKYYEKLDAVITGRTIHNDSVYKGKHCSLTICPDRNLELSDMFGNCLVKGLPGSELFSTLRKHKGYLQTAGLICRRERRDELTDLLARSGVVRIMRAGDMSSAFCGEAHDGEYALRRYTRIVNIQ